MPFPPHEDDHLHKDAAKRSTVAAPLEEERNRHVPGPPPLRRRNADRFDDDDDDEEPEFMRGPAYAGPPRVGGADLNPFDDGRGGGMIADPRDWNPQRNPDPQPHFPGRVPHARFDPFGPPELGPQFGARGPNHPQRGRGPGGRFPPPPPGGLGFGAGPDHDHFPPPGNMFM